MELLTSALPQGFLWGKTIHCFETLPSTNTLAKQLAAQGAPEGTVIIANSQTGGRGRLGRSFESPAGQGLYLSVILRPNCPPEKLMHLTCAAGLAASDAIFQCTGLRPGIKWANDLVLEKRKLGGILTELGFSGDGMVSWAVVGIGINCTQAATDFPPELAQIAASLSMVTGKPCSPTALAAALLPHLEEMNRNLFCPQPTMARYRQNCVTLGNAVSVLRGEEVRHGTALSVDDSGALVVAFSEGVTEAVTFGEVSIRGMYGYL